MKRALSSQAKIAQAKDMEKIAKVWSPVPIDRLLVFVAVSASRPYQPRRTLKEHKG